MFHSPAAARVTETVVSVPAATLYQLPTFVVSAVCVVATVQPDGSGITSFVFDEIARSRRFPAAGETLIVTDAAVPDTVADAWNSRTKEVVI
jgi:hypothetical protein